jgi:cbb3-type cytochrome oxidase maturation protein
MQCADVAGRAPRLKHASPIEHAMSVLLYLVPAALGLGLIGLAAFLWSLRSGQYDDLDGAALRILGDDDIER